MVSGIQGAIIAAGRGDRLRASTRDDIPKPLVKVGGETMLSRQARALLDATLGRPILPMIPALLRCDTKAAASNQVTTPSTAPR